MSTTKTLSGSVIGVLYWCPKTTVPHRAYNAPSRGGGCYWCPQHGILLTYGAHGFKNLEESERMMRRKIPPRILRSFLRRRRA